MDTTIKKRQSGNGVTGGALDARFSFIDLFAGIGGFRIGLEALGGKCVFSVERDKFSRRTYEEWFGSPPDGGDINHIDIASIPPHTIMTAGFPCPAFSKAGESKRKSLGRKTGLDAEDDGQHIFTLAEVLGTCRPPAFLFENVSNLLTRDKGKTWDVIHALLTDAGYSVFAKVFNAKHFGVPQGRERVMIVGFDTGRFGDAPQFQFPEPQRRIVPVLADILEQCPNPKHTLRDGTWNFLQRHKAKHAAKGNGYGFSFASPHEVTNTLSARYGKDGSEILIEQQGKNPRKLSPRETARLMGFPEHLPIVVSNTQAYRQFGNAVVPAIVEAVGAEVINVLERHSTAAHLDAAMPRMTG